MEIPLVLINGTLGSGKTTLVERLLAQADFTGSMLIENEYASVNIDRQIIAEHAHDSVMEISGSCICCSTGEELETALAELVAKNWSKPVIIEATGMANSARLLQRLFLNPAFLDHYRLIQTILVIDPLETLPPFTPEIELEITLSDMMVINKRDLASPASLTALTDAVNALNKDAQCIITEQSAIDLPATASSHTELRLMEHAAAIGDISETATLPYVTHRSSGNVDVPRLVTTLKEHSRELGLSRFKGFVTNLDGSHWLVEATAHHAQAKPSTSTSNMIVAIGRGATLTTIEQGLGL